MNPRDMFFDKVYTLLKKGEDIIVVTPDLAAPSLDKLRKDFPNNYVSVGIAEQNLIAVSAGLALSGKKVIAWGLNPFIVTRALDQIRCTISMMNIPIIMAGFQAGLSSSIAGPTHVAISDLSILRTCQNITIYNISDCGICDFVFDAVFKYDRPYYLRFDKNIDYNVNNRKEYNFSDGFSLIKKGKSKVIISTGYHVKLLDEVLLDYCEYSLIDVFKIPFNKNGLINELKKYNYIYIVEEHVIQGGLSSTILELLSEFNLLIHTELIGIDISKGYPDVFGSREYFDKMYCLDKESLAKKFIK